MITNQDLFNAKLLVVDDEPANVFLLEEALATQGYSNIEGHTDSRKAVERYPEFQPDIVLLDLNMPYLDGFGVMERIAEHAEAADVPILILTGERDRETRLRALSSGASDFLTKPFDMSEISLRIENMLRTRLLNSSLADSNRYLATSNADLEQFAYIASHDLQEPLRSVARYVQLLQRRYSDQLDDRANEYIERVVNGAKRMAALIDSLLAYSRIGSRGSEFVTVQPDVILNQVEDDLAAALQESGGQIVRGVLPPVCADPTQLRQLLQNLIGNGLKFRGEAPPRIDVTCGESGDGWQFTVRDNGIGIDPDYHDRIFTIFQRLHTRDRYPGTGIGLSLCKRIVERHDGRIWVESEPGEGSAFHFTIAPKGVTDERIEDSVG